MKIVFSLLLVILLSNWAVAQITDYSIFDKKFNFYVVRPLLCNPLPSIGIARFLQYYGIVRPPTIHLKYSVFSCNFILFFEKWQVLPS